MSTRALVIEDSDAAREYTASILDTLVACRVEEAKNGFEALRMLPHGEFELIVTDMYMPDLSGLDVLRFARQHPRYAKVPIIVASAHADPSDRDRALSLGATAFLAKPFTPEALADLARGLLGLAVTEVP